jgi:Outer membrane protein beta-barrel domain
MKKHVKLGIVLGMVFLTGNLFGQTIGVESGNTPDTKRPQTSMHLILNAVGTNLNYGKSNSAVSDYKKSVLGAQLGVAFQAGITHHFSMVSEAYFIMKGGTLESNNPLTMDERTIRLYTIESPLLARFHFGKFHVNAGPSLAYNVTGKMKSDEVSENLSFSDSNNGFKRLDAGVQAGAGYTFRIKQKQVVLDVRYSYGLTNISYDKEMYNRYLNINLHFMSPWKTNPFGRK